jgi:hypothetical protein
MNDEAKWIREMAEKFIGWTSVPYETHLDEIIAVMKYAIAQDREERERCAFKAAIDLDREQRGDPLRRLEEMQRKESNILLEGTVATGWVVRLPGKKTYWSDDIDACERPIGFVDSKSAITAAWEEMKK